MRVLLLSGCNGISPAFSLQQTSHAHWHAHTSRCARSKGQSGSCAAVVRLTGPTSTHRRRPTSSGISRDRSKIQLLMTEILETTVEILGGGCQRVMNVRCCDAPAAVQAEHLGSRQYRSRVTSRASNAEFKKQRARLEKRKQRAVKRLQGWW